MRSDDFIRPMWFTAWIRLRTGNLIAEPGDCASPDVMSRGPADHFAIMASFVADRCFLQGMFACFDIGTIDLLVRSLARDVNELRFFDFSCLKLGRFLKPALS